jgi:hypothetical protein
MNWTPEKVREELPKVQVYARKSKKTYTGHIAGRKNDFASVWFDGADGQVTVEFSWAVIASALNNNKSLQF